MSIISWTAQQERNRALLQRSRYMKTSVKSAVLPLHLDPCSERLADNQADLLQALQIDASHIAISAVAELARLGEVDHLGGALDLIPALLMTLGMTDYEKVDYTIENAHTSAGYYAALASLGFLEREDVIKHFRQSLDIPGHVSWVPGGTQLNGGRLGVMIPAAVGQALGKRAYYGDQAWVICHCGDAGWLSGQALNGFNVADVHNAPITFVMNRNGIQLSGSNRQILDKDPRPIIESLGIELLEIDSLHDEQSLFAAYCEGRRRAARGRPTLIYPAGRREGTTLRTFAAEYGIEKETEEFAAGQGVDLDTPIWEPGSLMSYRDVESMLECLFLVNDLPGGAGHHDGNMKGRDLEKVLGNPMLQTNERQQQALQDLRNQPPRVVITEARPEPGTENLVLPEQAITKCELPAAGEKKSPRAGVQQAYELLAKAYPRQMFVVDCDLAPSTKLDKARSALPDDHQFELSIEEQVAAIMANGLSVSTAKPQFVVFGTFAAFYEGIAREGLEMLRYQRNLNGINEGMNTTFHLSHVGACTGRDHFSGWSLDWINLAIAVLPYLHRFYAPADARSAFLAVRDAAANYGTHIIGVPRDNLPVLAGQNGDQPLWSPGDKWEAVTAFRRYDGARRAILAFGAPAWLAEEVASKHSASGQPVDVMVVNGLPLADGDIEMLVRAYPDGLATIEDGLIGNVNGGLRGFAAAIRTAVDGRVPTAHVGITDPRIAPSEGHMEVWEHFGLTTANLESALQSLQAC